MRKIGAIVCLLMSLLSLSAQGGEYYPWNVSVVPKGGGKVYIESDMKPQEASAQGVEIKGVKNMTGSLRVKGVASGKSIVGYYENVNGVQEYKACSENTFVISCNGKSDPDSLKAVAALKNLPRKTYEPVFAACGVYLSEKTLYFEGSVKIDKLMNSIGETVTATATPKSPYEFAYWASDPDGLHQVSTQARYTFKIGKEGNLYAVFRRKN